ncbi:MAG: cation diffusion facilitator family transporter [Roseburia sp.]|nr:cation diffusion facilitator family transporter [Roseburia sp.]
MADLKKESVSNEQIEIAMKVSRNSILVNFLLSVGKLAAGVFGNSTAMVSDAVHSASDVFSTIIVIIGVKISGKESDENHPYGHERLECVAAILLAVLLAATGCGIGYNGLKVIYQGDASAIAVPTLLPLAAALVSIAAKEGMYWYTIFAAKKIKSGALKADAWHHRSDALSSVGSFVGILGAKLGFPVFDPIASIIICFFILKAAYDIFMDAVGKLTDEACDPDLEKEMQRSIMSMDGVLAIDDMKTRMFGNKVYVDIEIECDGNMTLYEAHSIAESVHDRIEEKFPDVKHCMVHVNPYRP